MENIELKENELIVSPSGRFGYQINPLTDIKIIVTREDLKAIEDGTKCFDLENNCVVDYDNTEDLKMQHLEELRAKRKSICFSIINRGQLWYETLSESQKKELKLWYKAWLDVTETLVEPVVPEFLLKELERFYIIPEEPVIEPRTETEVEKTTEEHLNEDVVEEQINGEMTEEIITEEHPNEEVETEENIQYEETTEQEVTEDEE